MLYTKTGTTYTPMSPSDEATARADPNNLIGHENGYDVVLDAAHAAQIRATWAASALPQVPRFISLRQAHLAVVQGGLKAKVDAAVAADTTGALGAWWEYSPHIGRQDPQLAQLGLTSTQLDQLFATAKTL